MQLDQILRNCFNFFRCHIIFINLTQKINEMKLFVLIFLLFPNSIYSFCLKVKTCYHNGAFNHETCKCDCFASYRGDQCEFENCKYQPSSCIKEFGIESCSQAAIANFCPLMCGLPICKCGFDSCLNGGQFLPLLCICVCINQYTGRRCDSFMTTTPTTTKFVCTQKCLNGAKFNSISCKCECNYKILFNNY
jgi:hypothetical protein